MMPPRDTARWYIPEEYTHLFHTPVYQALNDAERTNYNRLYSLRINEQFFTFEELFIQKITQRIRHHRAFRQETELLDSITRLKLEEEQHSRMFRSFNQRSRPDIYSGRDIYFARLSRLESGLLDLLVRLPGLNPALIFLMLAMEELTTAISTEILNHPLVNDLDQDYVELHRRHLRDEKRHVGIDVKILKKVMACAPASLHPVNAAVFRRIFGTILKPRRSTIRVIQHLAGESGRLAGMKREMIDAVKSLDIAGAFPGMLVQPSRMPVMYAMFAQFGGFSLTDDTVIATNESS